MKHIKGVPGDIANVSVREVSLLPVIYQSVENGFQAGFYNRVIGHRLPTYLVSLVCLGIKAIIPSL